MTRSGILLITVALIVVTAGLAPNARAICTTCGGEQDWSSSASNFLEGKPINDTPPYLSNPQRNRQNNLDFNSSLLKEGTNNPANSPNNLSATSTLNTTLNVDLKDVKATPNPVNSGSPVMITASFGNISNSQGITETNMTAYAAIRNSAGVEVAKANLERTSGDEYAGIWSANLAAGAYKATIVASASSASKMFNDALQIDVIGS